MDSLPDFTRYFGELDKQLTQLFRLSKQGLHPPIDMKHRYEGDRRAAVVLGNARNAELRQRMAMIHQSIFSMSIAERRAKKQAQELTIELDYSSYDTPIDTRLL